MRRVVEVERGGGEGIAIPPITHTEIYRLLDSQPYVYLIDHWEGCAIRIARAGSRECGLRFWQKFKGKREFESHPNCDLVHRAILDAGAIVEDGTGQKRPHTEVVTRDDYLGY